MSDNDTAALAVLLIFGLPTIGWIIVRMMKHMERMEMIKRGMLPPEDEAKYGAYSARYQAPPQAQGPYVAHPATWNTQAQCMLRKGIITTAVGVALFLGLSFIGWRGDGSFTLGPWLLGGLIPLFVGLAQVANAMLAGAQFPRAGVTYGPIPPPPPNNASTPPPASGSGPYAYRPGATEELPRTKPPQTQ